MLIPENWTFKSNEVAQGFDAHVREQLPWYDLATSAVAHLGRHYIPRDGVVYDIGASTGNIGNALKAEIEDRHARLIAIEESEQMATLYKGPGEIVVCDALEYPFESFDFAVSFLTLMFLPVYARRLFIDKLRALIKPGGALVIVDKVVTPSGYLGTSLRRLSMDWKRQNGVSAEDILSKELSLSGYQRPLDKSLFDEAEVFFSLGEFRGWVFERQE